VAGKKPQLEQEEIPGTEPPDRDQELYAVGLNVLRLEEESRQAKKKEKTAREEAGALLRKKGLTEYKDRDVVLWIEPDTKIKARRPAGRKKGRIKKVTTESAANGE
jgi:hypothetical protein